MELRSWMKIARFQTFWIHIGKNKPLNESCNTGQTSRTKMTFYSFGKDIFLLAFESYPN
ncbi:hypothetical protein Hanom_Chr11g00992721 [Helianthus anomalus]